MTRPRLVTGVPATATVSGRRLAAYQAFDRVKEMQAVLARIRAPQFPARVFDITKYGAAAGGQKDSTGAIAKAIAACTEAGGGRVVVPRGEFLTGPIHLK